MKKIYLIIVLSVFCLGMAYAQSTKRKKPASSYNSKAKQDDKFLQKQWWLGLKVGTNLTSGSVLKAYTPIVPTNYDSEKGQKAYNNFKQYGSQAAFEISFYFKNFAISIQPTYQHSRLVYTNDYRWFDEQNGNNTLALHYSQEQKLDYAVIPLLIKYDLTQTRLRPYVQAGGFGAFIINASKAITISGVDNASGRTNEFSNDPINVGAKELFAPSYWGLAGGVGANYYQGNVKFNLDILYQHGMTNVTNAENRYSNGMLASAGDAMDDMTLDNIVISIGCLFPLRFLGSGFKATDK